MSARQGIWTRIVRAHRQGRLRSRIHSALRLSFRKLRYIICNPASDMVSLHCPSYVSPDKGESAMVRRIFSAYKKMKEDESKASSVYSPSTLWMKFLDSAYANLTSGAKEDDIEKFHFFLSNFGTWKEYTAVESNNMIRDNMRSFLGRRYLANDIFYRQLKIWKWFYNNRKPISSLTYPLYGNQAGSYIDGIFVGIGSFFNEIYGAMLSNLVSGLARPIIAEVGAGYGKLAYFTLRNMKDFIFVDFDLPETLCLASYYLMKTFPDKKHLLYGEAPVEMDSFDKYDMIFLPVYEIEKLRAASIDLFINKNSLGEMSKGTVYEIVKHISRATRRYFFHMNHDVYPNIYFDDTRGLLGYEYPVPEDEFKLLFRYPDIGHMLYEGFLDFNKDIFIYLYERRNYQAITDSVKR